MLLPVFWGTPWRSEDAETSPTPNVLESVESRRIGFVGAAPSAVVIVEVDRRARARYII